MENYYSNIKLDFTPNVMTEPEVFFAYVKVLLLLIQSYNAKPKAPPKLELDSESTLSAFFDIT